MKVTVGEIRQIIEEEKKKLVEEREMNEALAQVDVLLSEAQAASEGDEGVKVIEALNKFENMGLTAVDEAIEKIIREINEYRSQGKWGRFFKNPAGGSPIRKGGVLAATLKNGFIELEKDLKINKVKLDASDEGTIDDKLPSDRKRSFNDAVRQAFSTKLSWFGGTAAPYLKIDDNFAMQVMQLKLSQVAKLINVAKGVADMSAAVAAADAGTSGAAPSGDSGSASPPTSGGDTGDAAAPAGSSGTGGTTPANDNGSAAPPTGSLPADKVKSMSKQVAVSTKQRADIVQRVVSKLNQMGKLKEQATFYARKSGVDVATVEKILKLVNDNNKLLETKKR